MGMSQQPDPRPADAPPVLTDEEIDRLDASHICAPICVEKRLIAALRAARRTVAEQALYVGEHAERIVVVREQRDAAIRERDTAAEALKQVAYVLQQANTRTKLVETDRDALRQRVGALTDALKAFRSVWDTQYESHNPSHHASDRWFARRDEALKLVDNALAASREHAGAGANE